MMVDLLIEYKVSIETRLQFRNGDELIVPAGRYFPCAFGIVVERDSNRCLASKNAAWKIGG